MYHEKRNGLAKLKIAKGPAALEQSSYGRGGLEEWILIFNCLSFRQLGGELQHPFFKPNIGWTLRECPVVSTNTN